jgi:hypothetical protein
VVGELDAVQPGPRLMMVIAASSLLRKYSLLVFKQFFIQGGALQVALTSK